MAVFNRLMENSLSLDFCTGIALHGLKKEVDTARKRGADAQTGPPAQLCRVG